MKNLVKFSFLALASSALLFTSCNEDDAEDVLGSVDDGTNTEETYSIHLNTDDVDPKDSETVNISELDADATEFIVNVKLESDEEMKRLYMTKNVFGQGAEKFELEIPGKNLAKKGDGSIDLAKVMEVNYDIPFEVLENPLDLEGTIVYKIWATTGRGDYRDDTNDNAVGVGTLTVNYGGENAGMEIKSYTAKMLAAPLADGSSDTFFSTLDGEIYTIEENDQVKYWDFGYYYLSSTGATIASIADYHTGVVDIPTITELDVLELNSCYFKESILTADDFESIDYDSLNALEVSFSDEQRAPQLVEGTIIEFVNAYMKKGLIMVTDLEPGDGSNDYIEISVKVQP